MVPDEATITQMLADSSATKGSAKLDDVWEKVLQQKCDKTFLSSIAARRLWDLAPEQAELLMAEVRVVLER